jgi:hypothetical protein
MWLKPTLALPLNAAAPSPSRLWLGAGCHVEVVEADPGIATQRRLPPDHS